MTTDVALIVTVGFAGIAAGAEYKPAGFIVPTAAEPPAIPLTAQFTAVFALPVTVAVKAWLLPKTTEAEAGLTATVTGGGGDGNVTVAWAKEDGLATEVARMVMVDEAGMTPGAV